MVLCVNMDLKMGHGKIAAQCCHAAIGTLDKAKVLHPEVVNLWDLSQTKKIALKIPNLEELHRIQTILNKQGIPNYLVEDAGLTQIPSGSKTVLGIGPWYSSDLDPITGSYKLY